MGVRGRAGKLITPRRRSCWRADALLRLVDGEVLSDTVPRVMLEGCPMDLIVQSNHARGLCIAFQRGTRGARAPLVGKLHEAF